MQLGALLVRDADAGAIRQNVETVPGSERARRIRDPKMPGRSDDGAPCWLPIDAKFPLEDYQRLQDALERADGERPSKRARKALETFFRQQARTIRENYVEPPHTTDFAILFVPTESLYAEDVARARPRRRAAARAIA